MEFLEGKSLKKRLAEVGRYSVAQALEVASQAGSALAAAHAVGIVHRDLKPENLFLVPDASAPSGERVKILDFGIAKVKKSGGGGSASASFRTEAGLIMGSPTYMSPEQCKDSADVDLRADIYSFATILYEMLAGRPPYVAATGVELLLMHLSEPPRPLRELAPDVPDHVEDAVMRALRQERSERFEGVPSFLRALRAPAGCVLAETLPRPNALGAGAISAAHVDQTLVGSAVSTFSQANAQIVSESGIRTHVVNRSLGRWLGLALGGLVVTGFALLLLFRRGHDTLPPAVHGATATPAAVIADVIAPIRRPTPDNAAPAVLGGAADGGTRPPAMSATSDAKNAIGEAASAAKQHQTVARGRPTMVKREATARKRRLGTPSPSGQPDEEDVAGF
jgi:serine/threonine-protein kinase